MFQFFFKRFWCTAALAVLCCGTASSARAATVQFQSQTFNVTVIPLPGTIPATTGCDLIFVYVPNTNQKYLVIPNDTTARASYDPDKQRFYRLDRDVQNNAGVVNAFTTLNSSVLNLDGSLFASSTEAPPLGASGLSALEYYQLDSSIHFSFTADITLVDPQTMIYRSAETIVYDVLRAPPPAVAVALRASPLPLTTTANVAIEHDGITDTLLLVQTLAKDTANANAALPDSLRAYTRAGQLFDELLLANNAAIPGYSGNASGVAVDPITGDIYILDGKQLIALQQQTPKLTGNTPKSGTYKGGTSVTLSGALFPSDARVFFDGVASPTVLSTPSTITCATPAHAVGVVDIAVTGTGIPAGTPLILSSAFTYINNPPTAVLNASPISGPQPLTVSFNVGTSGDSDGTLVKRLLDFGDGAVPYTFPADLTVVTVSHTYAVNGTYKATLAVTDNLGATTLDHVTIIVGTGGTDIVTSLVLLSLNLKVSTASTGNDDKLLMKAQFTLPDNVVLSDLDNAQFSMQLGGAVFPNGFQTMPISLDTNAQFNAGIEKLSLKALTGKAAVSNAYSLTYTRSNVHFGSALDPTINGRQTLALSVKFITALGRSLTFQKTGENQAVVNVKATKGKSATLTLTRK